MSVRTSTVEIGVNPSAVADADMEDGVRFELEPRHALTGASAKVLVLFVASTTFAVATVFAVQGFWPVLPFAGAEVALLVWAIHTSMRAGRERETITLTAGRVLIERRSDEGAQIAVFPRHWSRVKLHAPLTALHPTRLVLESGGRAFELGRFLTEDERQALAVRLRQLVGNVNESPALR